MKFGELSFSLLKPFKGVACLTNQPGISNHNVKDLTKNNDR